MNTDHSFPPGQRTELRMASAWRMTGYVAGLLAIEIGCYELALSSYTSWWLPPLVAEIAFLGAPAPLRPPSFRSRLARRCIGIIVANVMIHFAYVLPVVYHDSTPWDEEGLWRALIVAAQVFVAAAISLLRWLVPTGANAHSK